MNTRDWNRLYRQLPDGSFEDRTEQAGLTGAGYGMGVSVGDFDNDGYEDLYVTAYGGNKLYRNNGDGTFQDVTERAGVKAEGWSTSAAWVDLDGDGLLDLVVLRYLKWDFDDTWCGEHRPGYRSYCHPDRFQPESPLVFHNEGNGHFTEISRKIGLAQPGKGLGIAITDYNRDGHIDLVIANDSMVQHLFRNKSDGTFEETALASGVATDEDGQTYAGMGVDAADYDNDGLPDLIFDNLANQQYAHISVRRSQMQVRVTNSPPLRLSFSAALPFLEVPAQSPVASWVWPPLSSCRMACACPRGRLSWPVF